MCGGNRTRKGADTQQVLASVVRTARQRNLDLPALFAAMLRAPDSIVPDVFGLPPPPRVSGSPATTALTRDRARQTDRRAG